MKLKYSDLKNARIAGSIYLLVIISGIFSLMYVPTKLFDFDNGLLTK